MRKVFSKKVVTGLIEVLFILMILNLPVIIQVKNNGKWLGYSLWNVDRDRIIFLGILLLLAVFFELLKCFKCNAIIHTLELFCVYDLFETTKTYAETYTNIYRSTKKEQTLQAGYCS